MEGLFYLNIKKIANYVRAYFVEANRSLDYYFWDYNFKANFDMVMLQNLQGFEHCISNLRTDCDLRLLYQVDLQYTGDHQRLR